MKTRLVGDLSPEQTAELHGAFLADVVGELRQGPFDLAVAWALDGGSDPNASDTPVPMPTLDATQGLEAFAQAGAGLGERLFHGLDHLARRYTAVAAVGSDHPELAVATVAEAFARLEAGADVAVGPSEDGGYYLIAVRRGALQPRLFEAIAWSTDTVLRQTLERCAELGLEVTQLPVGTDVDLPSDLERLRHRLARDEVGCPHTRAVLARWQGMSTR